MHSFGHRCVAKGRYPNRYFDFSRCDDSICFRGFCEESEKILQTNIIRLNDQGNAGIGEKILGEGEESIIRILINGIPLLSKLTGIGNCIYSSLRLNQRCVLSRNQGE